MTQDEIIEMARFAGIRIDSFGFQKGFIEEFEAFVKLIAAKEKEACAKVVQVHLDATFDLREKDTLASVLGYIKAKGEQA